MKKDRKQQTLKPDTFRKIHSIICSLENKDLTNKTQIKANLKAASN